MRRLTDAEVTILVAARTILRDFAADLQDGVDETIERADILSIGKTHERLTSAAEGIFDGLNILSSHLDDPLAKLYVHARGQEYVDRLTTPFGTAPVEPVGDTVEEIMAREG